MDHEMQLVASFLEENWAAFQAHLGANGIDDPEGTGEEILDELKGDN